MGEAKRRGTFEERRNQAVNAGRFQQRPEPTYQRRPYLTTDLLDWLFGQFKVEGERTVREERTRITTLLKAERSRLEVSAAEEREVRKDAPSLSPARQLELLVKDGQ